MNKKHSAVSDLSTEIRRTQIKLLGNPDALEKIRLMKELRGMKTLMQLINGSNCRGYEMR